MHPAIDSNKTLTCILGLFVFVLFFFRFVSRFFFFFFVFFLFFFFVHYTYRVLCKFKNKHIDKIRISYSRLLQHNLAS